MSGIGPFDRATWWLEVAPVIIVLPVLYLTRRRFPLTTLLPAIGSLFCRQKNADMLEACGKFENRAARDKCRAEERARFTGVAKVC